MAKRRDPFDDFREEIRIASDGAPLCPAYRMDATVQGKDMRAAVGLGTVACCDFLRVNDISKKDFVLVEMTELVSTVADMDDKFAALITEKQTRKKYIMDRIRAENCLKVYGSMLVLCRMQQWPKRCAFWLVITGKTGQAKLARNLHKLKQDIESSLSGALSGALGDAQLVGEVKVLTADELRKKTRREAR